MRFWWVNHKQTFRTEIEEGYIWSPMQNNNGSRNESYINLTRTSPGDVVFSYASGRISAIGKVVGIATEMERPLSFGQTGEQWSPTGWIVPLSWVLLENPLTPKNHLLDIAPLLPGKHSPIRADGNGNQGIYLAEISDTMGEVLSDLIGISNPYIFDNLHEFDIDITETEEEDELKKSNIPETQVRQIVLARRGQGIFRTNVEKIEKKCRVTGIVDRRFLVAGHIKPWKDSSPFERLDGQNGFLLSPHIDKLFDGGWISFSENGRLILSHREIRSILTSWLIDINISLGAFTESQQLYLSYHRECVLQK